MSGIFISYSSKDSEIADGIVKVLSDLRIKHFRDVKDIKWGDAIHSTVRDALRKCVAILVIISHDSLKSQWVPYEIGHASALGKKILPFLTHPSIQTPLYMKDLHSVTTYEEVRAHFLRHPPDREALQTDEIQQGLNSLPKIGLRRRSEVPKPDVFVQNASEICIMGIGGHFAISQYLGFYESKIRSGCNLRVLLLDPKSPSVEVWRLLSNSEASKSRIDLSLSVLRDFQKKPGVKKLCKVRLSNVLLPFSMFAVDLRKETGKMVVEYRAYKFSIDDLPHILLSSRSDTYWFNYYREQFESIWSDSKAWNSNRDEL